MAGWVFFCECFFFFFGGGVFLVIDLSFIYDVLFFVKHERPHMKETFWCNTQVVVKWNVCIQACLLHSTEH